MAVADFNHSRVAALLPAGLLKAFRPRSGPASTATVLRSALWPIAVMSIIHRSYVLSSNGYITDDFGPVYRAVSNFRRGLDIYNEHFDHVDPHYLYPPGGTLLMAPFGYMPVFASHNWFVFFNTVAMIVAACLLVRLFNFSLTSVALPALLLAMFCTESVTNTLVFTNINGCILLCEVLFFRWLLDGRVGHQWWAGVAIGLSLVVKPLLAVLLLLPLLSRQWRALLTAVAVPLVFNVAAWPLVADPMNFVRRTLPYIVSTRDYFNSSVLAVLLLLPLLSRQWRALLTAVAVPLVFNVAAWPLVADPMNFVRRTLPYIFSTRDYFNSSVLGNGTYYGLPMWLILALRVLFLALAVVSLWLLHRYYRVRDPLFWMLTSSGVLLISSWLVLSLAQGYYSMMLFPFLMTVVLPNSVVRNWPAWLATYGFLTMDRWLMWRWPTTGRFLEYMKITYGWSLMLVVVFCVLYFRYLDAKAEGRLDDGIDPEWMRETRARDAHAVA